MQPFHMALNEGFDLNLRPTLKKAKWARFIFVVLIRTCVKIAFRCRWGISFHLYILFLLKLAFLIVELSVEVKLSISESSHIL